jgi:hypothetical protein
MGEKGLRYACAKPEKAELIDIHHLFTLLTRQPTTDSAFTARPAWGIPTVQPFPIFPPSRAPISHSSHSLATNRCAIRSTITPRNQT